MERLKQELTSIKKELNETKEENRILSAKSEQYKKRATYAKTKFYEIKSSTETNSVANNADSKYRLKNSELKQEIKKVTEEKYKLAEEVS